jgi:hypothetical protein
MQTLVDLPCLSTAGLLVLGDVLRAERLSAIATKGYSSDIT